MGDQVHAVKRQVDELCAAYDERGRHVQTLQRQLDSLREEHASLLRQYAILRREVDEAPAADLDRGDVLEALHDALHVPGRVVTIVSAPYDDSEADHAAADPDACTNLDPFLCRNPDHWSTGTRRIEDVPDEQADKAHAEKRGSQRMLLPLTADEPPVGAVVVDRTGDAWHHRDGTGWYCDWSEPSTWEQVTARYGPVYVVHAP